MIFKVDPTQFEALKTSLKNAPNVTLAVVSSVTGTLKTSDVTLGFTYDGSAELDVAILVKRSFRAKIAPESLIESEITKMFNDFLTKGVSQ